MEEALSMLPEGWTEEEAGSFVHEGGWQIRQEEDQSWVVYSPEGSRSPGSYEDPIAAMNQVNTALSRWSLPVEAATTSSTGSKWGALGSHWKRSDGALLIRARVLGGSDLWIFQSPDRDTVITSMAWVNLETAQADVDKAWPVEEMRKDPESPDPFAQTPLPSPLLGIDLPDGGLDESRMRDLVEGHVKRILRRIVVRADREGSSLHALLTALDMETR